MFRLRNCSNEASHVGNVGNIALFNLGLGY